MYNLTDHLSTEQHEVLEAFNHDLDEADYENQYDPCLIAMYTDWLKEHDLWNEPFLCRQFVEYHRKTKYILTHSAHIAVYRDWCANSGDPYFVTKARLMDQDRDRVASKNFERETKQHRSFFLETAKMNHMTKVDETTMMRSSPQLVLISVHSRDHSTYVIQRGMLSRLQNIPLERWLSFGAELVRKNPIKYVSVSEYTWQTVFATTLIIPSWLIEAREKVLKTKSPDDVDILNSSTAEQLNFYSEILIQWAIDQIIEK